MEILDAEKYSKAFENVQDFNFTKMSYQEIFDEMRQMLVYAFEDVNIVKL